MATLQEQIFLAILVFSFLLALLHAPRAAQLLVLLGLSYTGYIWSYEYLHDMEIFVRAIWDARHLHQLSETCRDAAGTILTERHYPWLEQDLYCAGELRGLEMWSSYRAYTSPHYLLFSTTICLFIYHVILKLGSRWLNGIFDTLNGIFGTLNGIFGRLNGIFGRLNGIFGTWPMVGDDAVPPHDALSLPGSYHTIFSLS